MTRLTVRRCVVFCVACFLYGPAPADDKPVPAIKPIQSTKTVQVPKPVPAIKPAIPPQVGATLKLPAVFKKKDPVTVRDLEAIQEHVQEIVPRLQAATVGLVIGRAQGSGVIVSNDGYVLTAAHVSGAAGRKVAVILPNGRRVRGTTLGANAGVDAGLIKITDRGNYPHVDIGKLSDVKAGDWCIAMGHPGGFRTGRRPVVRLGRVIVAGKRFVQTDAVLVGGDSGGPLFDMHGRVMGINSRIGRSTAQNIHAPISAYSGGWNRMAKSEVWGSRFRRGAVMGVNGKDHKSGCEVTGVPRGFPARKAGLKEGDVITRFDGKTVKNFRHLVQLVGRKKAGDKVVIDYLRDGMPRKVTLALARR